MSLTPQSSADGNAEELGSILIVDDLPEQLLVLETILKDLGQTLVFARSGREALREVLKREFAAILLDVNMPDMDGLETAALIRQYKRSAHTPIIFVTAYADEIQTARGYSLGAVDYILAPVIPEVLRSKLKVFVELNAMQQQVRRQANERVALAAAEAAQSVAEKNTRRSHFLMQASRVLSASLDVAVVKRSLLELIVPRLGDVATLVLCDDDRRVDRPLRCDSGQFSEFDFDQFPTAIQNALTAAVTASKPTPMWIEQELVVALISGERALGAIWVRLNDEPESETLLEELSNRAAVALENARLYSSLQTEVVVRQQAETLLQESNQRKDEFLAMLSHELRNPLASIRNAVEVIRLVAPPEPKLEWATDVTDRQVSQLTRLIDELLDVARINRGKIVLQTEPVDLLEVIAQSVETARPLIESKRHVLTQQISRESVWLRGDFARLSQIVSNVLNNAAKYTDEGGAIHLSVSVDDGHAVIAVRDNGIGIEADLLPKVFELFKQGEQSLDRRQGGLGVGLTLAQRLVHLHNGQIEAFSAGRGMGAEFRVILPCLAEVRQLSRRAEHVPAHADVHCRVLVVDDNVDAAQTVAMFLQLAGHEVKAVTDGTQALACAPFYAPEVIVLDIGLPSIDGYEVARRLRAIEQTQTSLLIALTGYGQSSDRQRAHEAGFDRHLVKPADPSGLARLIADWKSGSSTETHRDQRQRVG